LNVPSLGMGGFHLGTVADQAEVNNIVAKAIDHGINIFDNAWEFHRGLREEKLGIALKGKRDKVIVMSAVCTHGPNQDVAMRMLDASLTRLQTDHVDVWQIHEVIYHNDPERIYANDGVLEALTRAKQQGKVRFVGCNGHKHPAINLEMLNRGYAFDVVQMPLNPLDPGFAASKATSCPLPISAASLSQE
jgi:predicted aldo/keto reductase-like oxidoreductase